MAISKTEIPEEPKVQTFLKDEKEEIPEIVPDSFMSKGEMSSEEKERVAEGARNSLLVRMEEQNKRSADEAQKMHVTHAEYTEFTVNEAVNSAKTAMRAAIRAEAKAMVEGAGAGSVDAQEASEVLRNYTEISQGDTTGEDNTFFRNQQTTLDGYRAEDRGRAYKLFAMRSARSMFARREADARLADATNAINGVKTAAAKWNEMLKDYHDNVYKPINDTYDKLFMAYYTLSRDLKDENSQPLPFRIDNQNAVKKIVEYTGTYDETVLTDFETQAKTGHKNIGNPYSEVDIDIVSGQAGEVEEGRMEGNNKIHDLVTAEAYGIGIESFSEEQRVHGENRRIKFNIDKDFKVYLAREQYNEQGKLQADETLDINQEHDVNQVGLIGDEKASNGARIFSQNSAKVYTKRTKNGNYVRGFYVGDEFIPENLALVRRDKGYASDGENVFDWDAEEREKFRTAIRRSEFFRHINDVTIKDYIKYDGGPMPETGAAAQTGSTLSASGIVTGDLISNFIKTMGHFSELYFSFQGRAELPEANVNPDQQQEPERKQNPDARYRNLSGENKKEKDEISQLFRDVLGGVPLDKTTTWLGITAIVGKIMGIGKCLSNVMYFIQRLVEGKELEDDAKTAFVFTTGQIMSVTLDIADIINDLIGLDTSVLGTDLVKQLRNDLVITQYNIQNVYNSIVKSKTSLGSEMIKSIMDAWSKGEMSVGQIVKEGPKYIEIKAPKEPAPEPPDKTGKEDQKKPPTPFKVASDAGRYLSIFTLKLYGVTDANEILKQAVGDAVPKLPTSTEQVLREETGIRSPAYLTGLARAFAAIDLSAMLSPKEGAETDFRTALMTMTAFIPRPSRMSYVEFQKMLNFKRILDAVGASADWRGVLYEAATGKKLPKPQDRLKI